MTKFLLRRFLLLTLTMFLVSIAVFLITESSPGNVAKNVLGAFITEEQETSFLKQSGLDRPAWQRYSFWLIGNDWLAERKTKFNLVQFYTEKGFQEWWARDENGRLVQWKIAGDDLVAKIRGSDGSTTEEKNNQRWRKDENGTVYFWGLDAQSHAVKWIKGSDKKIWNYSSDKVWYESSNAPVEYIPLKKGFLRGDPGISMRTGRPVAAAIFPRLINSLVLTGIAFIIVMPLALFLGIMAGLNEGSKSDRFLSIFGMLFTVIPEFVTGIFLILVFSVWLKMFPGAAVFGTQAPWEKPWLLVLPVLTLTLVELGYILRITRSSMVEIMRTPYIRTAFLKGLPYWRVVFGHAVRNALMAPITVIMLHVNWLLGGIVIVEAVFGYPGLGKYLLDSALYKDVNALEAGAMILVFVAVGTQLLADILYTFINPRIRYV